MLRKGREGYCLNLDSNPQPFDPQSSISAKPLIHHSVFNIFNIFLNYILLIPCGKFRLAFLGKTTGALYMNRDNDRSL